MTRGLDGAVCEIVAAVSAALDTAGVESPDVDARRLVADAAGVDAAAVMASWRDVPPWPGFGDRLAGCVARRCAREPLQHIEGKAAFLDFEVEVGPGVLIPRPETETTALCAMGLAPEAGRFLDCGTGTGVLAIALARARPNAEVHATERSMQALPWAARNIAALAPRVTLHEAWFLGVDGIFDLVVANPPYVGAGEWEGLAPEVRDHDPRDALVPRSGDAFADIRLLLDEVPARLSPGGAFVCEIGATQGRDAAALARSAGWRSVEVEPDLGGRDRVLVCRMGPQR